MLKIIINNPSTLNALSLTLAQTIQNQLQNYLSSAANQTKVVLVTSTPIQKSSKHPPIAISGGDLKEIVQAKSKRQGLVYSQSWTNIINILRNPEIISIGAFDGLILGGGLELFAACDIRIISDRSKIIFKHFDMGLCLGYGTTERLSQILGADKLYHFLLSSKSLDSEENLSAGLSHHIISHKKWDKELAAYIESLRVHKKAALAQKKLLNELSERERLKLQRLELNAFTALWHEKDHQDALQAFMKSST